MGLAATKSILLISRAIYCDGYLGRDWSLHALLPQFDLRAPALIEFLRVEAATVGFLY